MNFCSLLGLIFLTLATSGLIVWFLFGGNIEFLIVMIINFIYGGLLITLGR